ncbi:MAG: rhomboid family intramembrane serine protease [Candidatus Eremiobacteraeota bacterium]|nr:rhomboid family intramembrane serine protease [Candidatus Eremiobacteraeota bacterium]
MIPIGDERRAGFFAIGTWLIVAINVYVFGLEISAPRIDRFINGYALIPYNLTHGIQLDPPAAHPYWLMPITAMFLHGSMLHIAFNMLFLLLFGPEIERYLGTVRFLIAYVLCGLAGGAAQVLVFPSSHIPEIGASGAIAGILGAYLVTFPTNTINTILPIGCFPLFLRLPAFLVIGAWAAIQFVHGFGAVDVRTDHGGTAYFAHIGGFTFGALVVGLGLLRGRRAGLGPRRAR